MLNRIFALIGFFAFFVWGLTAVLLGEVDIKPYFMASAKFNSIYLRIIIGTLCFAACVCAPAFAIWRTQYFSAKPKRQNIQSKLSKVCI